MLRIQYLDKDRFMRQVAASKGSVYLHLDNGETCDLKQDSATTELFQMMNAPAKGFSISVADPADVTGFLHYMLEAGRKLPSSHSHITAKRETRPGVQCPGAGLSFALLFYRMQRLMAFATASSSSCPIKPNFISCSSA